MKIVHVININGIGGAERHLPILLSALVSSGINAESVLIFKRRNRDLANTIKKQLLKPEIKYHLLSRGSILDVKSLIELGKLINIQKYDLVHSHLRHSDLWIWILKKLGIIKVPILTTMHGYRDSYQNKYGLDYQKISKLSVYYWFVKYVLQGFDKVVFVSNALKQFYILSELTKFQKGTVIYHGYPYLIRDKFPTKKKITSEGTINIAIIGRLIHMKGHRFALESFRLILTDYPNSVLHILGSGPEEKNIILMCTDLGVKDKVRLYGYVENVNDYLASMDVLLVPSIGEAFGMVFLESFANKVPVVAFDLPAGNEIISDGQNGLLAEKYNSYDLYRKVVFLFGSMERYNLITTNAYADLMLKFSVESMAKMYKKLYISVLYSK
jgi:glycosyltransferase involved in cell wall biosynthesis